jgi:hypothetical protein
VVFAQTLDLRNSVRAFNKMFSMMQEMTQQCEGAGCAEEIQGFWQSFLKQQTTPTDETPESASYDLQAIAIAVKVLHQEDSRVPSAEDLDVSVTDMSIDAEDEFESVTAMFEYYLEELKTRDGGTCTVRPPVACWFAKKLCNILHLMFFSLPKCCLMY